MLAKASALLVLLPLALTPYRVLAQAKTFDCSTATRGACISSIVPGYDPNLGTPTLVVSWIWVIPGGPENPFSFANISRGANFFQVRYAPPGGQDTQVSSLPGGMAGAYSVPLPPGEPSGTYTIKVQGCYSNALNPADCFGNNQQPWDVETYTLSLQTATTSGPLTTELPPKPACVAGLQQVASPCSCVPGLNQTSACDPYGTAACLSAAQLAKVPKCVGAQYLVCGKLPPIASRDVGGKWFNKVTFTCMKVAAQNSPGGKTGPPPNGTNLPISNTQNTKPH